MFKADLDIKSFNMFMKQLKTTVSDLSPAFRDAGEYLKKETQAQFSREVDPDNKAWEPLKPATLKRKKTTHILRESFTMYNSLYYEADKKKMEFGIKDKKAIYHQLGTRKMPARVIVGITNDRRGKINNFVILHIRRIKTKRAR